MHHDSVVSIQIFFAPDLLEQLFCCYNAASPLTEDPENGEFCGCQAEGLSVERAGMALPANAEAPNIQPLLLFWGGAVFAVSSKLSLYSGDNLKRVKGLCDIIICAKGQAGNFIPSSTLAVSMRMGKLYVSRSCRQKGKAIAIWKHHIKQRNILRFALLGQEELLPQKRSKMACRFPPRGIGSRDQRFPFRRPQSIHS